MKPWGRVGAPTLSPENDGASKCVQGVDDWALSPFLLTSDSLLPEAFCLECPPHPALPGFALGSFRVHSTTSPLPVTSSYFLSQTLHEQSRALLSPAYTDMSPLVATGSSTGTG